jgi:alpha-ketoglutarate-dependent taurine dioxygenase
MYTFDIAEFSNPKLSINLGGITKYSFEKFKGLDLIAHLNLNGYIVIKNILESNCLNFSGNLTNLLGEYCMINNKSYTVIENNPNLSKSKYDAYTNNMQPFHIDMRFNSPRINYITMYCMESANFGGDTLILDTKDFLDSISSGSLNTLKNCDVYYTASKQTKVKLFEKNVFNFNPLFKKIEFENKEDLNIFNSLYDYTQSSSSYCQFNLLPNDFIIINNKSFFHSRTPFEHRSKRKMIRTFHI